MKERPILFSGAMVLAILDGRKTMTRRIAKFVPLHGANLAFSGLESGYYGTGQPESGTVLYARRGDGVWDQKTERLFCPYGAPGDRLWVRETFKATTDFVTGEPAWMYRADDTPEQDAAYPIRGWRPSIFMPRAASRITLEVAGVRVERLQAITEDDARAEGVPQNHLGQYMPAYPRAAGWGHARDAFESLWDSINGKRAPWQSNPWVWVVDFKRAGG